MDFDGLFCPECRKTKQELELLKKEMMSNFTLLRTKIVATSDMIHKYQAKENECAKLMDRVAKLNSLVKELNAAVQQREAELKKALQDVEPLRLSTGKLGICCKQQDEQIKHYEDKFAADEILKQQLETALKIEQAAREALTDANKDLTHRVKHNAYVNRTKEANNKSSNEIRKVISARLKFMTRMAATMAKRLQRCNVITPNIQNMMKKYLQKSCWSEEILGVEKASQKIILKVDSLYDDIRIVFGLQERTFVLDNAGDDNNDDDEEFVSDEDEFAGEQLQKLLTSPTKVVPSTKSPLRPFNLVQPTCEAKESTLKKKEPTQRKRKIKSRKSSSSEHEDELAGQQLAQLLNMSPVKSKSPSKTKTLLPGQQLQFNLSDDETLKTTRSCCSPEKLKVLLPETSHYIDACGPAKSEEKVALSLKKANSVSHNLKPLKDGKEPQVTQFVSLSNKSESQLEQAEPTQDSVKMIAEIEPIQSSDGFSVSSLEEDLALSDDENESLSSFIQARTGENDGYLSEEIFPVEMEESLVKKMRKSRKEKFGTDQNLHKICASPYQSSKTKSLTEETPEESIENTFNNLVLKILEMEIFRGQPVSPLPLSPTKIHESNENERTNALSDDDNVESVLCDKSGNVTQVVLESKTQDSRNCNSSGEAILEEQRDVFDLNTELSQNTDANPDIDFLVGSFDLATFSETNDENQMEVRKKIMPKDTIHLDAKDEVITDTGQLTVIDKHELPLLRNVIENTVNDKLCIKLDSDEQTLPVLPIHLKPVNSDDDNVKSLLIDEQFACTDRTIKNNCTTLLTNVNNLPKLANDGQAIHAVNNLQETMQEICDNKSCNKEVASDALLNSPSRTVTESTGKIFKTMVEVGECHAAVDKGHSIEAEFQSPSKSSVSRNSSLTKEFIVPSLTNGMLSPPTPAKELLSPLHPTPEWVKVQALRKELSCSKFLFNVDNKKSTNQSDLKKNEITKMKINGISNGTDTEVNLEPNCTRKSSRPEGTKRHLAVRLPLSNKKPRLDEEIKPIDDVDSMDIDLTTDSVNGTKVPKDFVEAVAKANDANFSFVRKKLGINRASPIKSECPLLHKKTRITPVNSLLIGKCKWYGPNKFEKIENKSSSDQCLKNDCIVNGEQVHTSNEDPAAVENNETVLVGARKRISRCTKEEDQNGHSIKTAVAAHTNDNVQLPVPKPVSLFNVERTLVENNSEIVNGTVIQSSTECKPMGHKKQAQRKEKMDAKKIMELPHTVNGETATSDTVTLENNHDVGIEMPFSPGCKRICRVKQQKIQKEKTDIKINNADKGQFSAACNSKSVQQNLVKHNGNSSNSTPIVANGNGDILNYSTVLAKEYDSEFPPSKKRSWRTLTKGQRSIRRKFVTKLKTSAYHSLTDSSVLPPLEEELLLQLFSHPDTRAQEALTDGILNALRKVILKNNDSIPGKCAYCRFFTAICRKLGNIERPRILCYDLMYYKVTSWDLLVANVVRVWKAVLSREAFGFSSPLLDGVEFLLVKNAAKGDDSYKSGPFLCTELSSMLKWKCGYSKILQQLVNMLKTAICLKDDRVTFECMRAMDLITRHQDWKFTNNVFVRKILWPKLIEWSTFNTCTDSLNSENVFISRILQLLGHTCLMCPREQPKPVIDAMKKYQMLLKNTDKLAGCVQEAAIETLHRLRHYDTKLSADTINTWLLQQREESMSLQLRMFLANRS